MKPKNDVPVEQDELWKEAIEELIIHFIKFFYADQLHLLDLEAEIVFLESELNTLSREAFAGNRRADKLVRVHTKAGTYRYLYIHIEVQGYKDVHFNKRTLTVC